MNFGPINGAPINGGATGAFPRLSWSAVVASSGSYSRPGRRSSVITGGGAFAPGLGSARLPAATATQNQDHRSVEVTS
jgi:hypothetical protein